MKVYEPARAERATPPARGLGEIVPAEVARVFREFRTAEVATLGKDGTPLAWPLAVLYQPERGRFLTTTSIGLPQKAFNARRDGRVSLLYSNPTASGLTNPPAVIVQGDATVSDDIRVWDDDLRQLWKTLAVRQPAANVYATNPLTRWLMDWYYMRLTIAIVPRRIAWWPEGDFSRAPREIEVGHVG
jgi:hypothetical protein